MPVLPTSRSLLGFLHLATGRAERTARKICTESAARRCTVDVPWLLCRILAAPDIPLEEQEAVVGSPNPRRSDEGSLLCTTAARNLPYFAAVSTRRSASFEEGSQIGLECWLSPLLPPFVENRSFFLLSLAIACRRPTPGCPDRGGKCAACRIRLRRIAADPVPYPPDLAPVAIVVDLPC